MRRGRGKGGKVKVKLTATENKQPEIDGLDQKGVTNNDITYHFR